MRKQICIPSDTGYSLKVYRFASAPFNHSTQRTQPAVPSRFSTKNTSLVTAFQMTKLSLVKNGNKIGQNDHLTKNCSLKLIPGFLVNKHLDVNNFV